MHPATYLVISSDYISKKKFASGRSTSSGASGAPGSITASRSVPKLSLPKSFRQVHPVRRLASGAPSPMTCVRCNQSDDLRLEYGTHLPVHPTHIWGFPYPQL